MGRLLLAIAAFGLLIAGVSIANAQSSAAAAARQSPAVFHQRPAYIVVDADSDVVLGQRDANKLWHPASVTKLMTAYLAFQVLKTERLKLTSPVIETREALAEPPSKMDFAVGTSMTVDNALKMLLVHSANDIAVAVAETVGGSEAQFVSGMNPTARSLGMSSTHYENPNGLPSPGQVTTARDLAVLARAILRGFPQYGGYFRIPAIKVGQRILQSQNALLERYPGATGMKTSFICDSGFNVVASANRKGRTLIVVVLGAPTALWRDEFAAKLLNVGFSGGSFGFARVDLASFHARAAAGPVVNLHDAIYGGHRSRPSEEDADVGYIGSTLGRPTAGMSPLVVYANDTNPRMITEGDAGIGVAVDPALMQPRNTKIVRLPRSRPSACPRMKHEWLKISEAQVGALPHFARRPFLV